MESEVVLRLARELEHLSNSAKELVGSEDIYSLRSEYSVPTSKRLEEELTRMKCAGRLLQIGIIGRVKSGKSSLLNALFFGGESVLPKAATPMTAALTTLSYGDDYGVTVDLYDHTDLQRLKDLSRDYDIELASRTNAHVQRLSTQRELATSCADEAKMRDRAKRLATMELRANQTLSAAKDHWTDVCARTAKGISLDGAREPRSIRFGSLDKLSEALSQYVAADGPFTPFCKSLHLTLPFESLRDLVVVDTPGLNDPIQSRERRTSEELSKCDVIFVVSPAGSFLTEEDQNLISRIIAREGVLEVTLVASQIDNQLFGSEKKPGVQEAIDSIIGQLTGRAAAVMTEYLRGDDKELQAASKPFTNMRDMAENHLLHASGISQAIKFKLEHGETLGPDERTIWDNLREIYCDDFKAGHYEGGIGPLDSLANTSALLSRIEDVRRRKDEITLSRVNDFISAQFHSLEAFSKALVGRLQEQLRAVRSGDAAAIDRELVRLSRESKALASNVDITFELQRSKFINNLESALHGEIERLFERTSEQLDARITTDPGMRKNNALWYKLVRSCFNEHAGTSKEKTKSIATAQASAILHEASIKVEVSLRRISQVNWAEFGDAMRKTLSAALARTEIEIDPMLLHLTINALILRFPSSDFALDVDLPEALHAKGTISGDAEVRSYLDDASKFLLQLSATARRRVKEHTDGVRRLLPDRISQELTSDLAERMVSLRAQRENATETTRMVEATLARLTTALEHPLQAGYLPITVNT